MTRRSSVVARLLRADGYSLTELVAVLVILVTIVTALTTLFVSGSTAQLDETRRVQAQQEARLALDRLRRDGHCARALTLTSAASITMTLPGQCPSAGGTETTVTYDTALVSASRYRLRRKVGTGTAVPVADYLTSNALFSYSAPSASSRGSLHVELPVNVNPSEGWKGWKLVDDIVLRNTARS